MPATLQEFGRSVVLGTDPAGATALIEGLPKRKAKSLRPGVWGIDYVAKDDVTIEVQSTGAGAEVVVTSLTEYLGFPQGLDGWQRFATQLEAAATAQGVPVQRGARAFQYQPAPANTLDKRALGARQGRRSLSHLSRIAAALTHPSGRAAEAPAPSWPRPIPSGNVHREVRHRPDQWQRGHRQDLRCRGSR